jgi:hypothetical protein
VDVYALTCVLVEMLTGQRPFPGNEVLPLMYAHLHAPPPMVTEARPELPAAWDDVIAQGMAKRAGDRYPTASALAAAADLAQRGATRPIRLRPAAAPLRPDGAEALSPRKPPGPDIGPTVLSPLAAGAPHADRRTARRHRRLLAAGAIFVLLLGAGLVAALASGAWPRPTPTTIAGRDLGVTVPLSGPACDGRFATIVGSAVQPDSYASAVQGFLDGFPGSSYLYAPNSCRSIRARSGNGDGIYAVYYGPYPSLTEACAVRRRIGGDSYVRRLDEVTPADQNIICP